MSLENGGSKVVNINRLGEIVKLINVFDATASLSLQMAQVE